VIGQGLGTLEASHEHVACNGGVRDAPGIGCARAITVAERISVRRSVVGGRAWHMHWHLSTVGDRSTELETYMTFGLLYWPRPRSKRSRSVEHDPESGV